MNPSTDYERLQRLSSEGDLAAAAELLEHAERRQDTASVDLALTRLAQDWLQSKDTEPLLNALERIQKHLLYASVSTQREMLRHCADVADFRLPRGHTALSNILLALQALEMGPDAHRTGLVAYFRERGDLRGEHIEASRALERARNAEDGYDSKELHALYKQVEGLKKEAKSLWTPDWLSHHSAWIELRWGLPISLSVPTSQVPDLLERALDALPTLRILNLQPYERLTDPTAQALAQTSALSRVGTLAYANTLSPQDTFPHLLSSPHLGHIRQLWMSSQRHLHDDALVALAQNPSARRVRNLEISGAAVGDVGCIALARGHCRETLEAIGMAGAKGRWSHRGIEALARLPRLRKLNLSQIPGVDARAISILGDCERLEALDLYRADLDDAMVDALLGGAFPALEHLGVTIRKVEGHLVVKDPEHDARVERLRTRFNLDRD